MKKCVIWGGKGLAKMVRPILERDGYKVLAIFDSDPAVQSPFSDIPISGGWKEFLQQRPRLGDECGFVAAIGANGKDRCDISQKLSKSGLHPINVIHETAYVSATASFGEGILVMPMAVICETTRLGAYCLLNTNSSVDHGCSIGDGFHAMPGATIAGEIIVGDYVSIGSNATVLPRLRIGNGATIGAGAVVTKDVSANCVMVGNPARMMTKRDPEAGG
jgi:sugar O-acyltransferase (sialic acid O-acetyltransferase NeuD family)